MKTWTNISVSLIHFPESLYLLSFSWIKKKNSTYFKVNHFLIYYFWQTTQIWACLASRTCLIQLLLLILLDNKTLLPIVKMQTLLKLILHTDLREKNNKIITSCLLERRTMELSRKSKKSSSFEASQQILGCKGTIWLYEFDELLECCRDCCLLLGP